MAENDIISKWVLQTSNFKGLWFDFKTDGIYYSELPQSTPVIASGTYIVEDDYIIDVNQVEHSKGLKGKFAGRYEIEGDIMKLVFNLIPGGAGPTNLKKTGLYKRE